MFKVGQEVWLKSQKKYGRITGLNDSKTAYQIEPIDFNFTKTRELPFTFRYFLAEDLHQTAHDMFADLGYEKDILNYKPPRKSWSNEKDTILYTNGYYIIKFYLKYKYYKTILFINGDDDDREHTISKQLHLAIHQKMVELGWLR